MENGSTWEDREELLREDAGKDQLVVRRVVVYGRPMVDIRRHYDTDTNDDGGDPVYAPGRKGVLISEELAARVGEALQGPRTRRRGAGPQGREAGRAVQGGHRAALGPEGRGGEPGVGAASPGRTGENRSKADGPRSPCGTGHQRRRAFLGRRGRTA
jgi:hypothetical protein